LAEFKRKYSKPKNRYGITGVERRKKPGVGE
jgi:hypothetical protein